MDRQDDVAELTKFTWERQPEAGRLVLGWVNQLLAISPPARALADRMTVESGTRFIDWVDYIELAERTGAAAKVQAAGFVEKPEWAAPGATCWVHPGGMFPLIAISGDEDAAELEIGIKVESVADFAAANGLPLAVDAPPLSALRRLTIWAEGEGVFCAIERHGYRGMNTPATSDERRVVVERMMEMLRCRPREFANEAEAFDEVEKTLETCIEFVGRDVTCELFFAAEREYWQRRNHAAQFQKARQDRLGLGWANHDHHTYRCSRKHFARLIGVWEKLGLELRERFYAGAEAGWGAQICEQPNAGIITFNDVDLSPEELVNDFSHEPLPERAHLGTVGLWCALHGESFLQAGMHHLECQFDFDSLRAQMERDGNIKTMKPFTDFPHLRQAFTEGERWPVKEGRIAALLERKQITPEQAAQFRTNGALGSHLENLERNDGFKGFNQKGVSEIIAKTDPRRNVIG